MRATGAPDASRRHCRKRPRPASSPALGATPMPSPLTRVTAPASRSSAARRKHHAVAKFDDTMRVFRGSDGRRPAAEAMAQLRAASSQHLRERAARARRRPLLLAPLVVGVVLVNHYRMPLFHSDEPVRLICAFALVGLGAWFARDAGRAIVPTLSKRMDKGTAGTIGFLLRFILLVVAVLIALRIAGLTPRTLAVGGAVTAIVLGLAAQSTIGNVFAGLLILSVQPFRVGERVQLRSGPLGGLLEGTVTQLGLLYVTLADGDDTILVPNNAVVAAAVVPLRSPGSVDLKARLRPGIKPSE